MHYQKGDIIVCRFGGVRPMTWQHAMLVLEETEVGITIQHSVANHFDSDIHGDTSLQTVSFNKPTFSPDLENIKIIRWKGHSSVVDEVIRLAKLAWKNRSRIKYSIRKAIYGFFGSCFIEDHQLDHIVKTFSIKQEEAIENKLLLDYLSTDIFCSHYIFYLWKFVLRTKGMILDLETFEFVPYDHVLHVHASNCLPEQFLELSTRYPHFWETYHGYHMKQQAYLVSKQDNPYTGKRKSVRKKNKRLKKDIKHKSTYK